MDASGTGQVEQSDPWKKRILFWMEHIRLERTQLQSEQVTAFLQFKMVAGVRPVLQLHKPLTSLESLQLVDLMARVDHGLITFM